MLIGPDKMLVMVDLILSYFSIGTWKVFFSESSTKPSQVMRFAGTQCDLASLITKPAAGKSDLTILKFRHLCTIKLVFLWNAKL
jgi:hypothetical protein